jgi:formamidopyrimidine-DNA glycosylase
MPELPEVETTLRGVEPYLLNRKIQSVEIRDSRMRWPIENSVYKLAGQKVLSLERRAKYLLLHSNSGTLILHLGMSGSLRICPHETELKKHDHFIVEIEGGMEMRLHDPRRFGAVLWHDMQDGSLGDHFLLNHLGPEPLSKAFNADYLSSICKNRKTTIKQHIMNNKVVVGVGNIYACEALFRAAINPQRKAGNISKSRLFVLTEQIKQVLGDAIKQGGTTLRDFLREDGQPGYFKQRLKVYDREGKPCRACKGVIKKVTLSNRSTFYCPKCQR